MIFFKTVYKPNIAKTVYIFILHLFIYKNTQNCIYSVYLDEDKYFTIKFKAEGSKAGMTI